MLEANSGTEPPCRLVLPLQRTALHGRSTVSPAVPLHSRAAPRTTAFIVGISMFICSSCSCTRSGSAPPVLLTVDRWQTGAWTFPDK